MFTPVQSGLRKTVTHSNPHPTARFARAAAQTAQRANASINAPITDGKADSFAQQLVAAIQDYLGRTNSGVGMQIDIRPGVGQNSGGRQFVVTVTDTAPTLEAPPAVAALPAPGVPLVVPTLFPDTGTPYNVPVRSGLPYRNSAEAYWAAQPPEVQELRTIPDQTDRDKKAQELAAHGFTIDYPIMVSGWDPLSTMHARINAGYTWIPAVGQPSIEVTAGASFPGKTSYDPRNPPPGSIPVSTAFADGYDV